MLLTSYSIFLINSIRFVFLQPICLYMVRTFGYFREFYLQQCMIARFCGRPNIAIEEVCEICTEGIYNYIISVSRTVKIYSWIYLSQPVTDLQL